MIIQPQVGPLATTASLAAGQQPPVRAGNMGDLIMSELHGRYYEATYRRANFSAANQAAQATTVALATTYTGLALSNPINSTVNLILNKVGIGLSVAPAAIAVLGLMAGFNSSTNVTHTTPGTPRSRFFGAGSTGFGLVDTSATFPTAPVVVDILSGGFTAASLPNPTVQLVDVEGGLILPPGAYAAIYTLTSVTGFFSFAWEEVPV
jgi:hypothetical protein